MLICTSIFFALDFYRHMYASPAIDHMIPTCTGFRSCKLSYISCAIKHTHNHICIYIYMCAGNNPPHTSMLGTGPTHQQLEVFTLELYIARSMTPIMDSSWEGAVPNLTLNPKP